MVECGIMIKTHTRIHFTEKHVHSMLPSSLKIINLLYPVNFSALIN